MSQVVNRKRHHAVNLNPISLDRFTVSGDKRPTLQPTEIRHAVVPDKDDIALLWP
ncbi:TPA: hypothetical protein ACK2W2_003966 [Klebsiella michiganensis]